jgi:hypothetical protein
MWELDRTQIVFPLMLVVAAAKRFHVLPFAGIIGHMDSSCLSLL